MYHSRIKVLECALARHVKHIVKYRAHINKGCCHLAAKLILNLCFIRNYCFILLMKIQHLN